VAISWRWRVEGSDSLFPFLAARAGLYTIILPAPSWSTRIAEWCGGL